MITPADFCNCPTCREKRGGGWACSTCEDGHLTKKEAKNHGQSHFVYVESRQDVRGGVTSDYECYECGEVCVHLSTVAVGKGLCPSCEGRCRLVLDRLYHATLLEEDVRYMNAMKHPPKDVQLWLNSFEAARWNLRVAWRDVIKAIRESLPGWIRRWV